MRRASARRAAFGLAVGAFVAMAAREAAAQVRWDLGASAGAAGRFLSSRPEGEGQPSAGPAFDAAGHILVLPLVRIGAYVHFDESAVTGVASTGGGLTRDVFAGGFDLRLVSPWPQRAVRLYLRSGIGEAGVRAPGHLGDGEAGGASTGGHFTEVPLGLGIAYRPYAPFWLTAEAGARLGFAFGGEAYDGASLGHDAAAAYLVVGVMWGR